LEYNLTVCQPDIALLDDKNKVFAVIEIVVTHKPEVQVIQYYRDNDIILIQINLQSDEDIDNLETKISKPNLVSICFNPKCKTCGNYLQKKIMTVIDGDCWKCQNNMKIATISSGNGGWIRKTGTNLYPSDFTDDEIVMAKSKGVILKMQYSKTAGGEYLANSCTKCGTFAGEFHLFTQYVAPAGYGELFSESFFMGYHCEECE
jgi:hypothetical protein